MEEDFPVAAGIVKRQEGKILEVPYGTNSIGYVLTAAKAALPIWELFSQPRLRKTEKSDHLLIVTRSGPATADLFFRSRMEQMGI